MTIDEFWEIALERNPSIEQFREKINEEEELDEQHRSTTYRIPLDPPISLSLQALPPSEGIWGPLGSEAWYGSALLSIMILQFSDEKLGANCKDGVSVLELGSGAVGLSGIATALRLGTFPGSNHSICLTDNEPKVLLQLEANRQQVFEETAKNYPRITLPNVTVEKLDWNDIQSDCETRFLQNTDWIIGSELVYTPQTAKACASCVEKLLCMNPNAIVLIVQVRDREGWEEEFLPTFLDNEDFSVVLEEVIEAQVHELAQTMIHHGGSLDRFDFVACYIRNRRGLSVSG